VLPPLVEYSHLIILPVFPLEVKLPLLEFAQTVVTGAEIVTPTGAGSTVMVTLAVLVHPFAVPVTV